jgi:hypothetical protein
VVDLHLTLTRIAESVILRVWETKTTTSCEKGATMTQDQVRVHSGSAFVRGKARKYKYFVASLFTVKTTKNGKNVFVNSGINTSPRASFRLAEEDGRLLAQTYDAVFADGYGSLHNKTVPV